MGDRPVDPMPFCRSKAAKRAFVAWRVRLEGLGVELGEPDMFLVGLIASREARLEELASDLARCRDESRKLRIIGAERMAAQDMGRVLDQAERIFGSRVSEDPAMPRKAGAVLQFPRPSSILGQRIVATLTSAGAMNKPALRKAVKGNHGAFLSGLAEALSSGAVVREGSGTRTHPYVYRAGGA